MTDGLSRQQRRALASQKRKESKRNRKLLKSATTIVDTGNVRQGWIPKGEVLNFAGRSIPGMVYFGIPEKYYCSFHDTDHDSSVYIDPRKEVLETGDHRFNDDIIDMLDYGSWNPALRAKYLDWLANGKCSLECNIAYPVLYFYGLERRYFFDDPDANEKSQIREEVEKLHDIYGEIQEFQTEAERFMFCVQDHSAKYMSEVNEEDKKFFTFFNDAIDGFFEGVENRTFYAKDCLQYMKEVNKRGFYYFRVNDKWFERLFLIRFNEEYPDGIHVEKPEIPFQYKYVAASGEFEKTTYFLFNGKPVYDSEKMSAVMDDIVDLCGNLERELGHYFSYVRQNPDSADSFKALKFLPIELWDEFGQHGPEIEDHFKFLTSWARNHAEQGLSIPASKFDFGCNSGFWRSELQGMHCNNLRKPLALCGFGAAPDYWLRFRDEKSDDPVLIYKLDSGEKRIAPDSESYQSALTEISVGAYVLQTEKRSAEESGRILTEMISQKTELTENERRGLIAKLKCILEKPHDNGFLNRLADGINTDWINGITRILVDLAHVDGTLQRGTVSVIEMVYQRLGLDSAQVYSDLHSGRVASDSNRMQANGSAVSELDESRIKSIRTDTEEVARVLGGIFTDEDNAKEIPLQEGQIHASGLDNRHATLLQKLLERDYWTLDEFGALVREHGLLPDGAIETINEWTFERYDEPLLEGEDGYHVAPEIAGTLKIGFETGH